MSKNKITENSLEIDQNPNQLSPMKKQKILGEKQQTIYKLLKNISTDKNSCQKPSEPLLQESEGQYVIFPINNDDMWQMYKQFVAMFWSPKENLEGFEKAKLSLDERQFLKFFATYFASTHSQGLVTETYAESLCKSVQVTEARFFYGHQLFVQGLHLEVFNKVLDSLMISSEEKEKLFKIVKCFDSLEEKRDWIGRWKKADLGVKLSASACVNGLFFLAIDVIISWMKRRRIGGELRQIFEKIIADQELCRDFDCLLLSYVRAKPSRDRLVDMINSAARTEFDFILNGLKIELIEFDENELIRLIDRRTSELKSKIFEALGDVNRNFDDKTEETNNSDKSGNEHKENYQKIVFDEDF